MITILTGFSEERDTILAQEGITVLCGVNARDNLESYAPKDTTHIISWGTCGGISPSITVGTICLSESVILDNGTEYQQNDKSWLDRCWQLISKVSVWDTVNTFSDYREMAATPEQRATLYRRTNADTVDMDSYAVCEYAKKHNIPWLVVGAVSDSWDQTVVTPPGSIDAQGNVDVWQSIEDLLSDPSTLPEILAEAWTASAAIHSLTLTARILAYSNWGLLK